LTRLEVGLVSVDNLLVLLQKTPVLKTLVLKVSNYLYLNNTLLWLHYILNTFFISYKHLTRS
jgi:hypothetical protein